MDGKGGRMTTDDDGDIDEAFTSRLEEEIRSILVFFLVNKKNVKPEPLIAATKSGIMFLIDRDISMISTIHL
jgi:hypothetical protein